MYNRSVNKLKYLSIAVNALKRLKNQTVAAARGENPTMFSSMSVMLEKMLLLMNFCFSGEDENQVNSQRFRGNIPLNPKKCNENGKGNWSPLNAFECFLYSF